MTTAERLTAIANNVPLVYAAGKAAGGGGGSRVPVDEKDVNFWDYDGTLLYSYTLEEVQALTELPPGPDWHKELVLYEWNWTLQSLQEAGYQVDVGALYDTDDSAAHLHITVFEHGTNTVQLVADSTDGNIDWGDGTAVEAVTVSTPTVFTHTYVHSGDYVIRVWGDNDTKLGYTSGTTNCFNSPNNYALRDFVLRKAFVGTKCKLNRYTFAYCLQLEHATLNPEQGFQYALYQNCSNLVCSHGSRRNNTSSYFAYWGCISLRVATSGDTATHINSGQFRDCRSLRRLRARKDITLSEGYGFYANGSIQEVSGKMNSGNTAVFSGGNSLVKFYFDETSTGVASQAFESCFSLQDVDIPASVTTIGAKAFNGCYNMKRMKFRSETPPTVASADAFNLIPSSCIVEVPAASLTAYQEATNYGGIAAQMVGV